MGEWRKQIQNFSQFVPIAKGRHLQFSTRSRDITCTLSVDVGTLGVSKGRKSDLISKELESNGSHEAKLGFRGLHFGKLRIFFEKLSHLNRLSFRQQRFQALFCLG